MQSRVSDANLAGCADRLVEIRDGEMSVKCVALAIRMLQEAMEFHNMTEVGVQPRPILLVANDSHAFARVAATLSLINAAGPGH
jgi:hypothetical protein